MIVRLNFLDLIEDIKKALDANAHLSALALSLALPDICGKVQYSDNNNKARYIKWYDENITLYNYPENFEEQLKFDGAKCYALRCSLLHAGEIDNLKGIDKFELVISTQAPYIVYGGSAYSTYSFNGEKDKISIRQDIAQLCLWIYSTAEGFYNKHLNKSDFDNILKGVTLCISPKQTTKME